MIEMLDKYFSVFAGAFVSSFKLLRIKTGYKENIKTVIVLRGIMTKQGRN